MAGKLFRVRRSGLARSNRGVARAAEAGLKAIRSRRILRYRWAILLALDIQLDVEEQGFSEGRLPDRAALGIAGLELGAPPAKLGDRSGSLGPVSESPPPAVLWTD